MNTELLYKFKAATGWDELKILNELKKVTCNSYLALDVYLAAGRLPDKNECDFINECGFDAWFSLWQRGMMVNSR